MTKLTSVKLAFRDIALPQSAIGHSDWKGDAVSFSMIGIVRIHTVVGPGFDASPGGYATSIPELKKGRSCIARLTTKLPLVASENDGDGTDAEGNSGYECAAR